MRKLEKQTGQPHPLLEQCPPLSSELEWLQAAFLRLHRRRQHTENGLQPLSHSELSNFIKNVLEVPHSYIGVVTRIFEATDDAVLYDFYQKQKESRSKS